ncbi:hypothetical protein M3P05_15375 [Sansalvadorimonas sp. 2012CJ34-2]|uniref:Chromosome segregation ATPase n=1 Tax=Parendozoicomonas callyspongiae TaxID=2942213 RepID=A0ABT0PIX5_9GAMM|nr:hypothetical protein [Sansalvadorimonas sp. 2012CJ34-2]MCL6271304.1 hypothetical protein [Sansalvadorimonas sp. 2012CJ34-2]
MSDTASSPMTARHGMSQLYLIQSGTYAWGELPLDGSVSFFGSNNRGKSTAINALQFFFLPNMMGSRFEKYSKDVTRKFYFPYDNSYILTQITTSSGPWVLGIVGKGAASGHRYQHFVYRGQFNKWHFFDERTPLKFADVRQRIAMTGEKVTLLDAKDVEVLISGGHGEVLKKTKANLGLVPVGGIRRYQVFKNLFVSLITQSEINAGMIKQSLLDVFSPQLSANDMAQGAINFHQKKEEVFAEYERLKREFDALGASSSDVEALRQSSLRREKAAGMVFALQNGIEKDYHQWNDDIKTRLNELGQVLASAQQTANELKQREQQARHTRDQKNREEARYIERINQHEKSARSFTELGEMYDINSVNADIEQLRTKEEKLSGQLGVASLGGSEDSLRKEMTRQEQRIEKLEAAMTADETLAALLSRHFSEYELLQLGKLMNEGLLMLPVTDDHPVLDLDNEQHLVEETRLLLSRIKDNTFEGEGYRIHLAELPQPRGLVQNKQDLQQQLEEEELRLNELDQRLSALLDHQEIKEELKQIRGTITRREGEVADWKRWQESIPEYESWVQHRAELKEEIQLLEEVIADLREQQEQLSRDNEQQRDEFSRKNQLKKQVSNQWSQLKNPGDGWPNLIKPSEDFSKRELEDRISLYREQWQIAHDATLKMQSLYANIRLRGYRAAESEPTEEAAWRKVLEDWEARPEAEQMLMNHRKTAILQLSSVLNDFLQDFLRLEREVNGFNRSISRRKVSNLKQFRIHLQPVQEIYDAIRYIVDTGQLLEETQPGLTFDAPALNNSIDEDKAMASTRIIASRISESLSLADIFTVSFEVEDANGELKRYDKIDDAGSTGTRSTLKLLTLMYLIRHMMDKKQAMNQRLLFTIDEIASVDSANARQLLESAEALGFTPLLTSVYAVDLARYGIDVVKAHTGIKRLQALVVNQDNWITLERKITGHDAAIEQKQTIESA